MFRIVRVAPCLVISFVALWAAFCTSGCSKEALPPAALLAGSGTDPFLNGAAPEGADRSPENGAASQSGSESEDQNALAPDAAIRQLINGLAANQPDALWDSLPASYQNDLNGLASRLALRLHPEAWKWWAKIARKGKQVISELDLEDSTRDAAQRLLDWAAAGEKSDLEQLKKADLRAFLCGRGRMVMSDVRSLIAEATNSPEASQALRDVAGPVLDVFREPSLLQMSIKDLDGDSCRVEIQLPSPSLILTDLYRFDVAFVRVEGKWVPQWLAENWSELMAILCGWIDDALPAEQATENFGVVFRYLAQLDAMVEYELARARGDQSVEPTLFDIVDYLAGMLEDLGFPIPAGYWGAEENPEEGMPLPDDGTADDPPLRSGTKL